MTADRRKPSPHDPAWQAFCDARTDNSALAARDWTQYRDGLRRLLVDHAEHVPLDAIQLELAEDAFFCAAHWRHPPSIVKTALNELLELSPDASTCAYAAAEYWKWATLISPPNLAEAESMVQRARANLGSLDARSRDNLERMFVFVVDTNNPYVD